MSKQQNKSGIEVFMYDKGKDDNKSTFLAVDQEFVYAAPKNFSGLGCVYGWSSIDSDGNEVVGADCELEDGQRYVVNSRILDDGEEYFYPEPLSDDDDDA